MISKARRNRAQVSLARAISKIGIASRAESRRLILEGHIEVNGRPVYNPGLWLDPRSDRITRDGRPLKSPAKIYLALHKPRGVVTTRTDERGRSTVYSLLPPGLRWVFPVGRLDKESSGLLLLTNDTAFGEAATGPDRKVDKTYLVVLDRLLTDTDRRLMEAGMTLRDGTVLSGAVVHPVENGPEYEVTIQEGKNRQIRRMCEALGYEVRRLHRVSIGAIVLGGLQEGKHRNLTALERQSILNHI